MKEKTFKDLGLDDDNGKMKKLETDYNLEELFSVMKKEDKVEKEEKSEEK